MINVRTLPALAVLMPLIVILSGCYGPGQRDDDDSQADDDDSQVDDDDSVADDDDDDTVPGGDTDGDGISDEAEGAADNTDTDGDGTPDYLDSDSDDDGIPDSEEGAADPDGDGIPNFQDEDSDNDGMADDFEGTSDSDGDGTPDYLDTDSDGDGVPDSIEGAYDPDEDGIGNYLDNDSDGDGLPDSEEGGADFDGDGLPNSQDLDSDGDGIPDSEEGDGDTDGDGAADYVDLDSDGDLISDGMEVANGTNPLLPDSDGDGVDDLIETALGTNANDPLDNPANNGDMVFVVPSRTPTYPLVLTSATTTNYQEVDLYVMLDHTCSMDTEIAAMKTAATSILEDLTCDSSGGTCLEDTDCAVDQVCSLGSLCIQDPAIYDCVPSLWSGSGEFGGMDEPPFSWIPYFADPIVNNQPIGPDPVATANSIPGSTGGGGDERLFQTAECVANPGACDPADLLGCASTGVGCPGFRANSVRIMIQITDEEDQCGSCSNTASSAGAALMAAGIQFVGINAGTYAPALADLEALATAAGSVDASGLPFVREGVDSAVVAPVTSAVLEMIGDVLMTTTFEVSEVPGDAGDALPFLDHIEVNNTGVDLDADGVPDCSNGIPVTDSDGDGYADSHVDVLPGTAVCWDVHPQLSGPVTETGAVQVFVLHFIARGNGAVIDEGNIHFVVPPFAPKG